MSVQADSREMQRVTRTRRLSLRVRTVLHAIGRFQSALILMVIYVLCWVPVGWITCVVADWLRRRAPSATAWQPRPSHLNEPSHAREPF